MATSLFGADVRTVLTNQASTSGGRRRHDIGTVVGYADAVHEARQDRQGCDGWSDRRKPFP